MNIQSTPLKTPPLTFTKPFNPQNQHDKQTNQQGSSGKQKSQNGHGSSKWKSQVLLPIMELPLSPFIEDPFPPQTQPKTISQYSPSPPLSLSLSVDWSCLCFII
jgi:hypothetical protein